MSFVIREVIPSAEDFNRLREAAGWGRIDPHLVDYGLAHSIYTLCAFIDDEVVGFVRLIGDGALKISVEELLVHPAHRRQGIARELMAQVMAFIETLPVDCSINLMAAEGLQNFYAAYGFKVRPPSQPGMQMRRRSAKKD